MRISLTPTPLPEGEGLKIRSSSCSIALTPTPLPEGEGRKIRVFSRSPLPWGEGLGVRVLELTGEGFLGEGVE